MTSNWYFAKDGQKVGPFKFDQVKQLAASGAITLDTQVYNEGASVWVPASSVPGLCGYLGTVGATPYSHENFHRDQSQATDQQPLKTSKSKWNWLWVLAAALVAGSIRYAARQPGDNARLKPVVKQQAAPNPGQPLPRQK